MSEIIWKNAAHAEIDRLKELVESWKGAHSVAAMDRDLAKAEIERINKGWLANQNKEWLANQTRIAALEDQVQKLALQRQDDKKLIVELADALWKLNPDACFDLMDGWMAREVK